MNRDLVELTEKDIAFINGFTGDFQETAVRLGISFSECHRIAARPVVRAAVLEYFEANKNPLIAERNERLAFWTRVMRAEEPGVRKSDIAMRLRAAELLGKAQMDFVERKIVEVDDKRAVPKRDLDERIARLKGEKPDEDWLS